MRFRSLFEPDVDWDGIESARGRVSAADLPKLAAYYDTLDDWTRKVAVLQLVQDQSAPALEPLMLDVLQAPAQGTWIDDTIELSKAVALGFLDESLDRFMHYYQDRAALKADVDAFLATRGLSVLPARTATTPQATTPQASEDPKDQFVAAIASGDTARAAAAVERLGANASLVTKMTGAQSVTPLIYALICGQIELAEQLLAMGASPTTARSGGQTPLWWAASKGAASLVQILLEKGADANAADQHGGTPLMQARPHPAVARILLAADAKVDATYYDGRSAAWFAAYEGHFETLALLLEQGVEVNEPQAGRPCFTSPSGRTIPRS
ncbi:MAG: ankyrin repeat domain-containing protein [Myxococcota bacterium]